ncbi:MAG: PQQ-binding-like beta-propeller repeat protein [Gemmataceae bacterium]
MKIRCSIGIFMLLGCGWAMPAWGADWPMARYDARRGNVSVQELPAELHLRWVRELPALEPAWPDQAKMRFDAAYEPIVLGQTMFVGSSRTDTLKALDTETGAERWRFRADGPIRLPPVGWEGKVYCVSDDGHLYCLNAADGALLWKFRGGPTDRRVLGNSRLISTWPARGGPVLVDDTIYFTAGIWPFMGIFIHAIDARTGQPIWTNDGDGSMYIKQPHNSDSFAGVAPQGPLAVSGDYLLLPGGRSVPACYDRSTGKFLYYHLAENGKRGGGSEVVVGKDMFINGGAVFDLPSGKHLASAGSLVALDDDTLISYQSGKVQVLDLTKAAVKEVQTRDRKGILIKVKQWQAPARGELAVSNATALIKAGERLYLGGTNWVAGYAVPRAEKADTAPAWRAEVEGTVARLLAADDKLFAVTREGRLYCFAGSRGKPQRHPLTAEAPATPSAAAHQARAILEATKLQAGYAVVRGAGNGDLVLELIRQSNLHLIVIEPDAEQASALRARLERAGLYGTRAAVHVGEPAAFTLPPYLASLIVVNGATSLDAEETRKLFETLRPYGGAACWTLTAAQRQQLTKLTKDLQLSNAKVRAANDCTLLIREGALPGAANWTHEHADAANTRVSQDQIVRAPLGILWFGGSTNNEILPRHGHGPQPQVIDGRLIIEGVDLFRALDIYTGRILWETKLPGVGRFYDISAHQPGANASGTNFISTSDGIYVAYGKKCVRLDPDTGKITALFALPPLPGQQESPRWGYINVIGDYLIGGGEPIFDPTLTAGYKKPADDDDTMSLPRLVATIKQAANDNMSSSRQLVVLDRHTGVVHWQTVAQYGFRHNATCAGGGRLYTIDRLSGPQLDRLKRRGAEIKHVPRLRVFDLADGKELWSSAANVFGTWLSYAEKQDVLLEAGRVARDSLMDEPRGVRAYRAGSGTVIWYDKDHSGPTMVHGDTILLSNNACDLMTGELKKREHPLTGEPVDWKWTRNYGCNTPMASQHLLTFRSGAAGFYDLCQDGGTGNFGGFRSSCSNNLVVAGGLLVAPDYTRDCTCSYQNQTSLALVPMPEAEMWTFFGSLSTSAPVRQVGVNLGAPGNRRADNGTLWLDFPRVGGPAPAVTIQTKPDQPEWFRRHASQVRGEVNWVAASGAKGITSATLTLAPKGEAERLYTVRLHFVEPDALAPGQRLFAVALQGRTVIDKLDISREASGAWQGIVKEFQGVRVGQELRIDLKPLADAKVAVPVLCGIEVMAEGE